jgi:hypothetical protein
MLACSSLIFVSNVGHSIYKKSYAYTSSFSLLVVSSVMWHGTRITLWFWIDQIALYNLVIVSIFMRRYLSKKYNDINIFVFIICLVLYGFEKVFFRNNLVLDTICHMLIHFIGCIGQHIILYNLDFDIPDLIELNASKKSETTKGTISSRNTNSFFLEN